MRVGAVGASRHSSAPRGARPAGRGCAAMTSQEVAIARTVIYASLFDYPLTLDQLRHSLLESALTKDEIAATYRSSLVLQAMIEHRDGLFFPRDRGALVGE